jgi:methyl-accepting chemotaxis protein
MLPRAVRLAPAWYEELLRELLAALGTDKTVERKILAAIGIQFGVSVAQAVVPFAVSGIVRYVLVGTLLLGATVAFYNTMLITRKDIVAPLERLAAQATTIGGGDVEVDVDHSDQIDEVGELTRSFADMVATLETVERQADALSKQDFDDPALAEDVPGDFGEALATMAENMEQHTRELESMTTELEARSERLGDLFDAFGRAAERARDGDLTATIENADVDEDHAAVIENYNELVRTLGETVGDVATFADEVAERSETVTGSMEEVDDASNEVARSVQEIYDGAADQTDDLQQIAEEMNTLSATVEEIAAAANEAADTAEAAAERGRSGRDSAEAAIDELDAMERRIDEIADDVEALAAEIDEIDEIASFIDDVAEQTNMLALNASIEAARAGEAGEGFAVVANEVKSLAEETHDSAEEISDRIADVQDRSETTVTGVQDMASQVQGNVDTVEASLRDFEDIVDVVGDVNKSVQEISNATDEQAGTTEQVVAMVDEVAGVSEKMTTRAETVAAAAEEQTANITEVTNGVSTLSAEAADLQALLDGFTLPAQAAVDGDSPTPTTDAGGDGVARADGGDE